jgi:gliding motility-associated-like protein
MKKLYTLILTCFIFNILFGQDGTEKVKPVKVSGGIYQFISKITGQVANAYTWDETEPFSNGFARVVKDGNWGFVDLAGNPLLTGHFESVRNFSKQLAAVKRKGYWGFIDEKGKTAIPFVYDIVFDFTENVTAVYKNRKWHLINRQGTVLKTLDIDIFYGFKNGLARVNRQGRSGELNTRGDIVRWFPVSDPAPAKKTGAGLRPGSQQAEPCPDNIGFDRGNFMNWECFVGDVVANATTNVITVNPSAPTANRHVIYPRTNPSALDPYGFFPINPPDGSGYALKLGNDVNGAEAERVRYQITVPANAADYSITYRYAVVFQDPNHERYEQPRLSAKLLDVAENRYLPCSSFEFVSDDSIPGFFNSPVDPNIKCKSWTSVFINLSAYAGKTLMLEFTTADCTKGAHWGYCYLDVGDCNISANIQYQCNPSIASLSGPDGFRIYRWFNEDFSVRIGTGQQITLNPTPPGITNMHLEVTPFNGSACSDTLQVTAINPAPIADAGPDKTVCLGASTGIGTAQVSGNTYLWSPATFLSNPHVAMPTVTPTDTATYILTVTKAADGCTAQDTVTVFVTPVPVAQFAPGTGQCINENNFSFNNTSTGATLNAWSFGDGNTSAQFNPTHSYAAAGTYTVKLVETNQYGCKDSVSHPVTVYANPAVVALNDASICLGQTVQLRATGAQSYEWSPALDLSCTNCPTTVASPATSRSYFLRGVSSEGCSGFDTVTITVHQPIQITVSPDREICRGSSVNLLAGGAASYQWTPAQGLSSNVIPDPVATPTATTRYRVIGFDGNNCFTDTGYINVTVNPIPTVNLGEDRTLLTGTIYPLSPVTTNGPISTWQWSPGTDLSCSTCPDPSATIKKDITYDVTVENIYGCTAADTIHIKTFCENTQVFIPNAFTPDGDGVNDVLMVRAKGIEVVNSFRIFSRWGELLFEKLNFPPNSPAYGWDGRIRGKTGAPEVYVYTVEVTCDNLQTYSYKGNVSILK